MGKAIFWALLFLSTLAQAEYDVVSEFYGGNRYGLTDSTRLDFSTLQEVITTHELTTVEDTLEYLKEYYPEFFVNYILMYHSRSLQSSSFENPRALLFDRSGYFVFSFNGNSHQRGFRSLEIMQFLPEQKRFEFREISFSQSGQELPKFSEANPAKCMACHQSHFRQKNDPRPNWEPYNIWPGAFGSINGDVPGSKYTLKDAIEKGLDPEMVELSKQEEPQLKNFLENIRPNHPRYKFLAPEFKSKHTTQFTEIIAAPNSLRAGRQIAEMNQTLYKYLKYPLLGLFQCQQLMVTDEQFQWLQDSLQEIGRFTSIKKTPYGSYSTRYLDEFKSSTISDGLIFLLEPFGVSTQDWSMDFQTDGLLAFSERFGVPGFPAKTAKMGYRAAVGNWEDEEGRKGLSCNVIGERAHAALQELFTGVDFESLMVSRDQSFEIQNQPLINRCIKCHESGDKDVPYIPFSDEALLSLVLHQGALYAPRTILEDIKFRMGPFAKGHERMPMGTVPTPQQTAELIRYLESL